MLSNCGVGGDFFFFWLCWVFVSVCGLSLVATSRGYSLIVVHGLLIVVASLVVEHRLSSCGGQAWLVYSMKTPSGPVMNPCALHQQADSHPSYHQRSPSNCLRFLQSPVSFKL